MSMTPTGAKELGRLIARARARKGLSVRQLAARVGVAKSWVSRIEQGDYVEAPAADRLARIGEVLEIAPLRIDTLTKGASATNLPGVRAYFRAKYRLTPEEIERIERYVSRFVKKEAA